MAIQFNVTLKCDHYAPQCEAIIIVPVYELVVEKVPGVATPKFSYDQIEKLGWSEEYYGGYGAEEESPRHYCPEHTTKKR